MNNKGKENRIPKDATVGDLVAFAESIGCVVEIELKPRAAERSEQKQPYFIFSGDYSADMWESINEAKTKGDLRRALYFVCCRLQEFESKVNKAVVSNRSDVR